MQSEPETLLYEYSVLRYVPKVERGEFFNIGLIMMCKRRRYIRLEININDRRFDAFDNICTREAVEHQLTTFTAIASGDRKAGEIAELPVEERFRWITAVKSACLQTSRPHPGLTTNLDATFEKLFKELVL